MPVEVSCVRQGRVEMVSVRRRGEGSRRRCRCPAGVEVVRQGFRAQGGEGERGGAGYIELTTVDVLCRIPYF